MRLLDCSFDDFLHFRGRITRRWNYRTSGRIWIDPRLRFCWSTVWNPRRCRHFFWWCCSTFWHHHRSLWCGKWSNGSSIGFPRSMLWQIHRSKWIPAGRLSSFELIWKRQREQFGIVSDGEVMEGIIWSFFPEVRERGRDFFKDPIGNWGDILDILVIKGRSGWRWCEN
jgi:hypothetical protein